MNPTHLRQLHASQIFHALRTQPGISQKDLAVVSGCDKSTVSIIIKRFEETGLVERTIKSEQNRRGRPSEVLHLSDSAGLLIGVHLEFGCLRFVAANVDGRVLYVHNAPLPEDAHQLGYEISSGLDVMLADMKRNRNEIRAVGVALPGLVGSTAGSIAESPTLTWRQAAIAGELRQQIKLPIFVDNDTNAAAIAEHFFGDRLGMTDFIMIDGGLGVGGGLFLDGKLYRGKSGFGGEIGHMKVVMDGRRCRCGAYGCLSAYVSEPAILERAKRVGNFNSLQAVLEAAQNGDEAVLFILRESAHVFGTAISTLVNLFNPPTVVLGGTFSRMWPIIENTTRQAISQNAMRAPLDETEIIISSISNAESPRGGVALALDGFSHFNEGESGLW